MTFDRKKLIEWYGFIKSQACANCESRNIVEAAHLRMMVSFKTGDILPRSHKTEAAWGCIPLCKTCHTLQHEVGERKFFEDARIHPAQLWGTLLVHFFASED